MTCIDRLVGFFGSQAEVARQFRVDRAVVNNWVKSGYVPARWAMEVENATAGQITAAEVLNEATARKPLRMKSRPDGESLFGSPLTGNDNMNTYSPAQRINSFHPPQRTLMGPGPTEIHPRVLTTMSQPAIGYLDPVFVEMMEELKSLLRYTFQTKQRAHVPGLRPRLGGHGVLLREHGGARRQGDRVPQRRVRRPHDRERRALRRHRRSSSRTSGANPVDPQKVEDALKKNPDAEVVAFVHAETSTGVQSDAKTLIEIAHKHDALVIMDAVTSLAGTPVLVDEWKIDAIYSASQKCLSCTPGLSPVSFSERVVDT